MKDLKETHEKPNESFDWDLGNLRREDHVHQALWFVGFIDEKKGQGTTIGESCGSLQWI